MQLLNQLTRLKNVNGFKNSIFFGKKFLRRSFHAVLIFQSFQFNKFGICPEVSKSVSLSMTRHDMCSLTFFLSLFQVENFCHL